MEKFEYKSWIEGFISPKNTKPGYIKVADMLLNNFLNSTKSTAYRFEQIEETCDWGVYLIGKEECKKILNLIINNIPNVVKDKNDVKYYQKNLRKYKKNFL